VILEMSAFSPHHHGDLDWLKCQHVSINLIREIKMIARLCKKGTLFINNNNDIISEISASLRNTIAHKFTFNGVLRGGQNMYVE
jgi:hypothetical protein